MSTRFFSTDEIRRLRSWPEEIGWGELISYFTLGSDDRAWVQRSARGLGNRLGLAVQLCALPWLGFVPDDVPAVPRSASNRLAVQLGLPVAELDAYGEREQTRTEHLRLAASRLGWRTAGAREWKELDEFLLARAVEHDAPSVLFRLACEYVSSQQVVRPGVMTLMERIAAIRRDAVAEVYARVEPLLDEHRRSESGCRAGDEYLAVGVAASRGDDGLADGDPG